MQYIETFEKNAIEKNQQNKWENFEPFSELNEGYVATSNEQNNDASDNKNNNQHKLKLDNNNVPVDLSNDIAVNQMLADQGAPLNPDAEIFNVNEYDFDRQRQQQPQYQPKQQSSVVDNSFEYLPFYPANNNRQNNIVEK